MFSANYAKPIEKRQVMCYTFICITVGKEKYTLLRILTVRTYKIYKERVDNDDEAAWHIIRDLTPEFCTDFI